MDSVNLKAAYLRAQREKPSLSINTGQRGEVSLDEARVELAGAISRTLTNLKGFESNLSKAKGDVTLVAQELLDRVMPPVSRRRK
jgi:hypothetical protein